MGTDFQVNYLKVVSIANVTAKEIIEHELHTKLVNSRPTDFPCKIINVSNAY